MRQKNQRRARGEGGEKPAESRASLYDEVTAKIIAELEGGRIPWVQPWRVAAQGSGKAQHGWNSGGGGRGTASPSLPRNAVTGRHYSGINVLILWGALFERGFASQAWLTFNQARDAGGCVRKGEHGVTVVYADRFTPEAEKERARQEGDEARSVPFLKRFTLFNVAQCDGLPPSLSPEPEPQPEREIVPVAEEVIAASGILFRIGGAQAFYSPAADVVQVPPQPAFFDQVNYYRTCLHELTHATGHASRLDRNQTGIFGSKDYAQEELVAEMGSAFLCASLGILPTVRHSDYIASWLAILRDDNRAIFRAGSAASKAADWLLSRHRASDSEGAADATSAAT